MSIIIFSRPRNSGKTTELISWCNNKENCSGILMPDVNGLRKMYNIQSKIMLEAEHNIAVSTNETLVSIGNFHFYQSSFDISCQIIETAINLQSKYILIDEVGKLELNQQGFYKAIIKAVQTDTDNTFSGTFIFTVRDVLIDRVLNCFMINNYTIINSMI